MAKDGNQKLIIAVGLSVVALFLGLASLGSSTLLAIVLAIAATSISIHLTVEVLNFFVDGGSKIWGAEKGNWVSIILMVFLLAIFGVLPQMEGYSLLIGLEPLVGLMALLYILLPFELAINDSWLHKTVILSGWFVIYIICYATAYVLGYHYPIHLTPFGW